MRRIVPHKLGFSSLCICIRAGLRSCCQVIERSDEQEENPLFTVS